MGETQSILAVRHGQTEANRERRLQGRSVNFSLNETGKNQIYRLGRYLCTHDLLPEIIVTSPLLRTMESAEVLGKPFSIPIEVCPDLAEIDFGTLENYTMADIEQLKSQFPHDEIYAGLNINIRYPGGELVRDTQTRVVSALKSVMFLYSSCSRILLMSHGGALRLLFSHLLKTDHIQPIYHSNAGLSIFEHEKEKDRFIIRTLNTTSHLIDPCYA